MNSEISRETSLIVHQGPNLILTDIARMDWVILTRIGHLGDWHTIATMITKSRSTTAEERARLRNWTRNHTPVFLQIDWEFATYDDWLGN